MANLFTGLSDKPIVTPYGTARAPRPRATSDHAGASLAPPPDAHAVRAKGMRILTRRGLARLVPLTRRGQQSHPLVPLSPCLRSPVMMFPASPESKTGAPACP